MSLAQLTFTQLRLLQLVCFVLPVLGALVLTIVARKKRRYVFFRIVDKDGTPVRGAVSTIVGAGARRRVRAVGRLDVDGSFRRVFTRFEPQTVQITLQDGRTGVFAVARVAGDKTFPAKPTALTIDAEGSVAEVSASRESTEPLTARRETAETEAKTPARRARPPACRSHVEEAE